MIQRTFIFALTILFGLNASAYEFSEDVPIFISSGPYSYLSAVVLDEYPDGYYLDITQGAEANSNIMVRAKTPNSEFFCNGIVDSYTSGSPSTPELAGIERVRRAVERMSTQAVLNLKHGTTLFIGVTGGNTKCRSILLNQDSRNNQISF